MNLINYQKAGEILGYSRNSGSVYELLASLDSHTINGIKHWKREDVERLRDQRAAEGKSKRYCKANSHESAIVDHLIRMELKVDRLIAIWEATK